MVFRVTSELETYLFVNLMMHLVVKIQRKFTNCFCSVRKRVPACCCEIHKLLKKCRDLQLGQE